MFPVCLSSLLCAAFIMANRDKYIYIFKYTFVGGSPLIERQCRSIPVLIFVYKIILTDRFCFVLIFTVTTCSASFTLLMPTVSSLFGYYSAKIARSRLR